MNKSKKKEATDATYALADADFISEITAVLDLPSSVVFFCTDTQQEWQRFRERFAWAVSAGRFKCGVDRDSEFPKPRVPALRETSNTAFVLDLLVLSQCDLFIHAHESTVKTVVRALRGWPFDGEKALGPTTPFCFENVCGPLIPEATQFVKEQWARCAVHLDAHSISPEMSFTDELLKEVMQIPVGNVMALRTILLKKMGDKKTMRGSFAGTVDLGIVPGLEESRTTYKKVLASTKNKKLTGWLTAVLWCRMRPICEARGLSYLLTFKDKISVIAAHSDPSLADPFEELGSQEFSQEALQEVRATAVAVAETVAPFETARGPTGPSGASSSHQAMQPAAQASGSTAETRRLQRPPLPPAKKHRGPDPQQE